MSAKKIHSMTFAEYWKTRKGTKSTDSMGRSYMIGRYPDDIRREQNFHRRCILNALIDDESVPARVLREYPELTEQAAEIVEFRRKCKNLRPGMKVTYIGPFDKWVRSGEIVEFRKLYPDGDFLAKTSSGKTIKLDTCSISFDE